MRHRILATLIPLAAATFATAAEPEWPQFRGPNGSGIAAATARPPVKFGPDKNVKWKVAAPSGASSPVVADDKLFLTAFDGGKLWTLAYSTADGKELWRTEAPAKTLEVYHKTEGTPAASSVATDGKVVVAYFGSAGLFAYDFAGKELWRRGMPVPRTAGDFGSGVSPILADGLVVLQRDELGGSKILAFDAATGAPKWEKKRQAPTSYSTPMVWEADGVKQVVTAGFGRMVSYDLKTGDEVWTIQGMPCTCCTTPVAGDGMLYFAGWSPGDAEDKDFRLPSFDDLLKQGDDDKDGKISKAECGKTWLGSFFEAHDSNRDGFLTRQEWEYSLRYMGTSKNAAFAVKAGGKGDITKTHVVWRKTKGLPYVPSGVLAGGQYFLVKDGGLCTAYDAKTGKEAYAMERAAAQGRYYASPVVADGRIYLVTLDDGTFTVLKAGTDAPEVVVKNPKLGERTAATPAIVGDTLYVRTAKTLWAFAEKK